MAKIFLSLKFIKETIMLFRERPLKEVLFGKKVALSLREKEVLYWIQEHPDEFRSIGGRKGHFGRVDTIHKGIGNVYLLPNKLANNQNESLILFDDETKIIQGPDLWIYLSSNKDVKRDGLGDYLKLVLIKGNAGGQTYVVKKLIRDLEKYKSVVIWCKQFAVLFTFAPLS